MTTEGLPFSLRVLEVAYEVVRHDGWTQEAFGLRDGPKCTVGALNYATTGETVRPFADPLALQAVARAVGAVGGCSISMWNDADDRTEDQVLDALDRAASIIRVKILNEMEATP